MCQPTTQVAEEAGIGIYQPFSGLVSVFFRTTNYSKNFYLSWCHSKFPTNFQTKSSFKTISNQITSPLLKTFNPSFVKMSVIKSQNLRDFFSKLFSSKYARYSKVKNHQNLWGISKVSQRVKSQKVESKGQNTSLKCQIFLKKSKYFLFFLTVFNLGAHSFVHSFVNSFIFFGFSVWGQSVLCGAV